VGIVPNVRKTMSNPIEEIVKMSKLVMEGQFHKADTLILCPECGLSPLVMSEFQSVENLDTNVVTLVCTSCKRQYDCDLDQFKKGKSVDLQND